MTKSCVATVSYACPPGKVWLYMTNPNLNHWKPGVSEAEISPDGMQITERNTDGTVTEIRFSDLEKPRRLRCSFTRGKIHGDFTAILLGGGDSTSLECTLEVSGLGLLAKPKKQLEEFLDTLRKTLGV